MKDVFRDPPRPELRGRRAFVALTDGVDSASVSVFAAVRAHFLQAGLLAYFVQVDTEEYVEDRLLADCQEDRTLRLSRVQLERYRRTFDPRADQDDYADFCRLGSFERRCRNREPVQLKDLRTAELIDRCSVHVVGIVSICRNSTARMDTEPAHAALRSSEQW